MTAYTGNGKYQLIKASLYYKPSENSNEECEVDLGRSFAQIDLYESLFEFTMSGQIAVVDSYNLQDILPLYGTERIYLEFVTAGSNNIIKYHGVVYKISEKHRISEHSSGYTIFFISQESINSQRSMVQKGYNTTVDKIVEDLYNRISSDQKILQTEQTKGIYQYCFGSMNPIYAISILSSDAIGIKNNHGFYFYEDNAQYNFKSVQELFTQDKVREYSYKASGVTEGGVDQRHVEAFNAIQNIEILEENSYLDRIVEGQHGLSYQQFDLTHKKLNSIVYDKKSYYNKEKSLGKYPYKKSIDIGDDITRITYKRIADYPVSDIVQNKMLKIEIDTIRIRIMVYGDSLVKVGNVCSCTVPNWNIEQKNIKSSLSGKFLITELHHILTPKQYTQSMMLQKEAYDDYTG